MDNTKRYERLRERYLNGDLDRRKFLGLIGAAGLAYGVQTPFARQALAAVEEVRFDGWGGVVSEAFRKHAFDPYTEKDGHQGRRRYVRRRRRVSVAREGQPGRRIQHRTPFRRFSITRATSISD
ncbi:twin-arginine translocation signal domain-containing protein [Roseibium salinum]|nr:twin-arginine translocation signal domain-containing protein [Roseibium salinum]